jgi:hypothetical protein
MENPKELPDRDRVILYFCKGRLTGLLNLNLFKLKLDFPVWGFGKFVTRKESKINQFVSI